MHPVRDTAVAGMFYPGEPEDLAREVSALLAVPVGYGPRPKALIVPHAGYVYSGPIAAAAFATIVPDARSNPIRRVVLLGPAHREVVDGFVHPDAAALAHPHGKFPVEVETLDRLGLRGNAGAHAREHCLEVMLPFLHAIVPHAKLIPLIGSRSSPEATGAMLDALWGGPETLIVISSDLSHHLPYDRARARDAATAARILALDPTLAGDDACGALAINGLLWLARKKQLRIVQLDLRNSGDTAGSRDRVVGYGAFALFEPEVA